MLRFFKKKDYTAVVGPKGTELTVPGGGRLLDAALEAGLDWPHDCRVGSCGACRCVLKSGDIKALTDFSYTLEIDDIRAGAILACQTQLRSNIEVDVELGVGAVATESVSGAILAVESLTHDIVELSVALDHQAFAAAKAGQYADISVAGIDSPRSYSFAVNPADTSDERVRFFIRHVPGGEFTDWLFAADRQGTRIKLSGPYGMFYQRAGTGRMICVAGGSGLAPIHALIEAGVREGVERDCTVLFGARAQRDLYYLDQLNALGHRWSGEFELIPVLSDEPADSSWAGARGLVTEQLSAVAGAAGFDNDDQGYLCGPPPMVDAGVAALKDLGMQDDAIFFDRFLDASTQPGGRAGVPSE